MAPPMMQSKPQSAVRVLCFGDSLTAGYCGSPFDYSPYATQLSQQLGIPVDHVGLSGWRSDEMMANLTNPYCVDTFGKAGPGLLVQLSQKSYDVCIIMAGTNDVGSDRSADSVLADLVALHRQCHARNIRTVALNIPESQFMVESPYMPQAIARQQVNQRLAQWAASMPGWVLFVDMASQVPYSRYSGHWDADGLHMSRHGYSHFGTCLGAFVKNFVFFHTQKVTQQAPTRVAMADVTNKHVTTQQSTLTPSLTSASPTGKRSKKTIKKTTESAQLVTGHPSLQYISWNAQPLTTAPMPQVVSGADKVSLATAVPQRSSRTQSDLSPRTHDTVPAPTSSTPASIEVLPLITINSVFEENEPKPKAADSASERVRLPLKSSVTSLKVQGSPKHLKQRARSLDTAFQFGTYTPNVVTSDASSTATSLGALDQGMLLQWSPTYHLPTSMSSSTLSMDMPWPSSFSAPLADTSLYTYSSWSLA